MKKIHEFEIDPFNVTFEPLAGSTLTNLLRLLGQNGFHISMIGMPRILYSIILSSVQSPLNLIERRYVKKHITPLTIKKDPIFIIGHWRSGTTYLHNLLTQDPQYSFPTTLQTVIPAIFIKYGEFFRPIVESSLPATRPEDNVPLGADLPQEEEYALGNLSPFSFYNGWCFPKKMKKYCDYVDFKDASKQTIDEFKDIYMLYLKKVSFYHKHKQLVLKNPSNTGRVDVLLDLFPNAKFIYIYRNPYHVYLSMKRNIEKEMTLYAVQNPPPWGIFETSMADLYLRMFHKYQHQKTRIPEDNLIEVKYEEFVDTPIKEMEKVYSNLQISDFKGKKQLFQQFVDAQTNIKSRKYSIDKQMQSRIYSLLHEAIDFWEYSV